MLSIPREIYLFAATRWEVSPELYQLPNTQVVITGIGMNHTYKTISNILSGSPHPARERGINVPLIVSVGFSGGTHPSLKPCDIVLSTTIRKTAFNNKQCSLQEEVRSLRGDFSSYHDTHFDQSRVVWGCIGTVPKILSSSVKQHVGDTIGVAAVDMESYAVALAAQERHLPFLAIRIILDSMNEPLFSWRPWAFPRRVSLARKILGEFTFRFLTSTERRAANNGL